VKKEQKYICKLCGYEAKNITALTTHLQYKHKDYNTQRYYDEFYKNPNEGFCEVCGKETKFRDIVKGYNKHCCKSCAHKTKHFRDSYKKTISKKSEKEKEVWKNKIRDKIRSQSSTGRYITDGEALKRKNKSIKRLKMIVENCDCTFVDYSMDKDNIKVSKVTFTCNRCGTTYTRVRNLLDRKYREHDYRLCVSCKVKSISEPEKEFAKFITENYHGTVLRNDRNILGGNELDVVLPELHIAYEFDGVFWHMDSRFYKPTDYNPKTNRSAQETWDRDNEKIRRCAEKGLTLIRIKEYDWLTDKELIKQQLLEQFK